MSEIRAAAERLLRYAEQTRRDGQRLSQSTADAELLANEILSRREDPATVEIESTDTDFWRQFMSFIQFTQAKPNTTTIRLKN